VADSIKATTTEAIQALHHEGVKVVMLTGRGVKIERRTELYAGLLRKFIEAMNGELVIAARFVDGVEVPIRLRLSPRRPAPDRRASTASVPAPDDNTEA
jgi:hypothetical protein